MTGQSTERVLACDDDKRTWHFADKLGRQACIPSRLLTCTTNITQAVNCKRCMKTTAFREAIS